jgi:ferritin
MTERMVSALNEQITREFYSAYLYLSMSSYLSRIKMKGMANWTKVQYHEELSHAIKMYDFLITRGENVILKEISKPQNEWKSVEHVFSDILNHEKYITENINNLMKIAIEENDYASIQFLQWFIAEQVEEEANAQDILDQLELIGDSKHGLVMLDKELGQRVFVDETQSKGE